MMFNKTDFPPLPSQRKRKGKLRTTTRPPATAKNALAPINDLPDELLLEILGYLPCWDLDDFNLPTILGLSLTNRRFHYMVADTLYSAYNSFFCTPYLFLRTCANSRRLAEKVKSSQFIYGPGVHGDRKRYVPSVTDRRELKAALKGLGIPGWKDWATDCNEPTVDQETLFAAILMFTPNITSLVIDDGDVPYLTPKWLHRIQDTVSNARTGHLHKFSHLRSIRVDIGSLPVRTLWCLFRLDSLRELTLLGLIEKVGSTNNVLVPGSSRIAPGSCPIEELVLLDCFIDSSVLVALLDSCRAIKKFSYQHCDERSAHREEPALNWSDSFGTPSGKLHYPTVINALRRHRKTLKNLQLWDDYTAEPWHSEGHTDIMGNLQDFRGVTHMKASINALVDPSGPLKALVENLPPFLKSLELIIHWADHEKRCLPALQYLAEYVRTYVPYLSDVQIELSAPPDLFAYDWERLEKLFRAAGVNLRRPKTLDDDDDDVDWPESVTWHTS